MAERNEALWPSKARLYPEPREGFRFKLRCDLIGRDSAAAPSYKQLRRYMCMYTHMYIYIYIYVYVYIWAVGEYYGIITNSKDMEGAREY